MSKVFATPLAQFPLGCSAVVEMSIPGVRRAPGTVGDLDIRDEINDETMFRQKRSAAKLTPSTVTLPPVHDTLGEPVPGTTIVSSDLAAGDTTTLVRCLAR